MKSVAWTKWLLQLRNVLTSEEHKLEPEFAQVVQDTDAQPSLCRETMLLISVGFCAALSLPQGVPHGKFKCCPEHTVSAESCLTSSTKSAAGTSARPKLKS